MTTTAPKKTAARKPAAKKTAPAKPKDPWKDWPASGGNGKPQPWDLDALGLKNDGRDLAPGAPNTVAPIVPRAGLPTLAEGSQHDRVPELCRRLEALGYPTSNADGGNPHGLVDKTVLQAVQKFRSDFGVQEAPTDTWGGETDEGRRAAANHIGPYTWEALIRASDREGFTA
jgi:peptidoglycan hydrolase-like protein with peptidoglycan-binding domain